MEQQTLTALSNEDLRRHPVWRVIPESLEEPVRTAQSSSGCGYAVAPRHRRFCTSNRETVALDHISH